MSSAASQASAAAIGLTPAPALPAHGSTELPETLPPRRSLQSRVHVLDNAAYHGGPRSREEILYLIYHATAGESAASSMGWLNRPGVPSGKKASYHYLIDRDGTIWRMTAPDRIAYHAGDSAWPAPVHFPPGNGGHSLNRASVGVAWANRDDGEALTAEQLESGLWLATVFNVPLARIRGHYEISPGRKVDPAAALNMDDWRQLVARYRAQAPAV